MHAFYDNKLPRYFNKLVPTAHNENVYLMKWDDMKHLFVIVQEISGNYDVNHFRGDNKNLKTQNDQLKVRVEKLRKRVADLEQTNEQHGILQEKMRTRLRQMDDHGQHTSQQVK